MTIPTEFKDLFDKKALADVATIGPAVICLAVIVSHPRRRWTRVTVAGPA